MQPIERRAVRTWRADRGFTLTEVLIVVVVMGVISGVMVAVAAVVFRNTPPTEARAEDARSMLGLVTWLPQDVDSTPPTGFDQEPSTSSGCAVSDGINILHLTWTEQLGTTTTTYIANYRHVTVGSTSSLVRVTCSGTSTPYTNTTTSNLTGDLPTLPVGWDKGDAPVAVTINREPAPSDVVTLVNFAITTIDGDVVQIDSAPKNPADTLPTTTLPSWYLPTPTTLVYTNTLPTASSHTISVYPVPTTINLTVSDVDGDSLIVILDPSTIPTGWVVTLIGTTFSFTPPVTAVNSTTTLQYTVDDQQGGGVVTGDVTVTVTDPTIPTTTSIAPTTTIASTTTTTTIPCAVTGASLSRNSVKNAQPDGTPGQVDFGVLFKAIKVTATTNGECDGILIRYSTGGANSPGFLNFSRTGPTTWSGTLLGRDEGSSETWADGFHTLRFESSTGGPYAITATLQVT